MHRAICLWLGLLILPAQASEFARRLNRYEYRTTIRDLLGVDFEAGDAFPADNFSYGFDNNAETLTVTPALVAKYLDAAGKIARAAVSRSRRPPHRSSSAIPIRETRPKLSGSATSSGTANTTFTSPLPGATTLSRLRFHSTAATRSRWIWPSISKAGAMPTRDSISPPAIIGCASPQSGTRSARSIRQSHMKGCARARAAAHRHRDPKFRRVC